jgi:predicted dehydrogenase
MRRITLLGTGLIGMFYAMSLHGRRGRDRVGVAYSRSAERAKAFAAEWGIPRFSTNMEEAIGDSETDTVIVALPNHLHEAAVIAAASAGKAVLCTKPLGRNAAEARRMLEAVERAGVFHGYLEDLCYTPKTLHALESVRGGAVGKVLWVRSRETHSGPHSDWFWIRPVEVMCWGDTQVHPIDAEDSAVGLVKYDNGAVGQFEVSWTFRGGMDLRDEVAGTEGTIWLNHWLRTGIEMFTAVGQSGYVAEKADSAAGWLFPVGDEPGALGYVDMFADMFDAIEDQREPRETFYDGYVVNSIIDAAYSSMAARRWAPVELPIWRGAATSAHVAAIRDYDADHLLVKEERMMDGGSKLIVRNKRTNEISERRLPSE